MSDAVLGCAEAVGRCLALLDDMDGATFVARPGGAASAGEHLRHCLDHFACFERGLADGCIDYDRRDRDPRVESDIERCRARFAAVRDFLVALDAGILPQPIGVRLTAAPGAAPSETGSTVERELAFLSGHTLHHLALAALTLRLSGAERQVDAAAFSTAAHRDRRAAGPCVR